MVDADPLLAGSAKADQAQATIREYRPQDDADCRALEARASGQAPPWTKWFLDTNFINFAAFDARVRQFELGGVTLVAELDGRIVGTICGAMKDAHFQGKCGRTCYIFDLRVAPEIRRQSLGQRLSQEVERIAVERYGAERIYLTVNADNQRAQGLYAKLGYERASTRAPVVENLLGKSFPAEPPQPCDMLVGDGAADALTAAAAGGDGTLKDFRALVANPNFLGVLRRAEDTSEAGLGLWDSANLSGFSVNRFIFPARWWVSPCGKLLFWLQNLGVNLLWAYMLWRLYASRRIISFGVASVVTLAVGYGMWKARHVLPLIGKLLEQSLHQEPIAKFRGRAFCPWAKGPKGSALLRDIVLQADRILAGKGFVMRVCNVDGAHPLKDALGTSGFTTFFMQKSLVPGGGSLPAWSPESFHDPRDI
mmetsp:Transcript_14627/g.41807  ORF Transcript_14627/g.41807 Transcript_14627/m.41807 type:complete len:423 (-) Transcript_14627:121-1389(-)